MNTRERFESKVDRSGGPDACHVWIGGTTRRGYGSFGMGGANNNRAAHRVSIGARLRRIRERGAANRQGSDVATAFRGSQQGAT